MNNTSSIRILLIEDDLTDVLLIKEALKDVSDFDYELIHTEFINDGIEQSRKHKIDVVLLDLGLPDSQGVNTFLEFNHRFPLLPVLVLTALDDLSIGLHTLSEGAQDYLIKKEINPQILGRAIRYAIERQELHIELQRSHDQLRIFAVYLQTIREQERTRMSREIHDELGQKLSALKMDLKWVDNRLNKNLDTVTIGTIHNRIIQTNNLVDDVISSVQRIAIELRPSTLDHLGLVDAIRDETRRFEANTEIEVQLDLPKTMKITDKDISTTLFRIYQELLTNILRHANAHCVKVQFKQVGETLVLDVRDDGVGMSINPGNSMLSLGLMGMRERAGSHGGTIEFSSEAGHGVHANVTIPLKHSHVEYV
ncbi:response regulator [Hahella sp. CR1]|uniref:hybrid sensor histidine kinase/response regulator n=1 Tax=Hahella sp. CR1 TaxID=2992807 RepID=UPI0024418D9D|nr:response regulator [Hahella sp. CR1]MDG9670860.1 response regulator [Hahella sp. CR1]